MGGERKCRARFGKQESEGKAFLEASEIVFRGDFRFKIPFSKIQSAKVLNGALQLRTAEGAAVFELGAATAAKWRDKILHPKSRIEKLGLKAGARVVVIGFGNGDREFIAEIEESTKMASQVSQASFELETEWIFLKAEAPKQLAKLAMIAKKMRGAAGLWVIYPKGHPKGTREITEDDVLSAGRGAGLKDVKVVGFSATHTALKFVIPVTQR